MLHLLYVNLSIDARVCVCVSVNAEKDEPERHILGCTEDQWLHEITLCVTLHHF